MKTNGAGFWIGVSLVMVLLIALMFRWLLVVYGLRVTSWFRSPWRNVELGGKTWSLHLIGWAADVVPVNLALQQLMKLLPFSKFVVESDHVHIQLF